LKQVLKTETQDTSRCYILNQLVENTNEKEWPAYNEQMGSIAKKNLESKNTNEETKKIYSKYLSAYYSNIGYEYHGKGDLVKGLEYYEKALEISQILNEPLVEAIHLNNIGYVYMDQGDIPKALDYFTKCLHIFEKARDKKGIAGTLNNIGYIYDIQGDKAKTKEYYLKCLKIRKEINDRQGLGVTYNNVGSVYKDEGNYTLALEYLLKSLRIREEGVDKSAVAGTMNNIGSLYLEQGNAIKALEYHGKSLKLLEGLGDKNSVAETFIFLGNTYQVLHQPDKAISAGEKAIALGKEIGFPEVIKNAAWMLNEVYVTKKDFTGALRSYELYIQMRDSIKNKETQKATIRSQFKIEFDKKELEAKAEQEKKDLKAEEEKQKQAVIRNSFIVGFALVLILALVIYRSFLHNKKKNKVIGHQKRLVEEKQKEILDSIYYAQRIQKALMPNEKYFTRTMDRLKK
jgi:tetratricopeptide (TPR) repeat protein